MPRVRRELARQVHASRSGLGRDSGDHLGRIAGPDHERAFGRLVERREGRLEAATPGVACSRQPWVAHEEREHRTFVGRGMERGVVVDAKVATQPEDGSHRSTEPSGCTNVHAGPVPGRIGPSRSWCRRAGSSPEPDPAVEAAGCVDVEDAHVDRSAVQDRVGRAVRDEHERAGTGLHLPSLVADGD